LQRKIFVFLAPVLVFLRTHSGHQPTPKWVVEKWRYRFRGQSIASIIRRNSAMREMYWRYTMQSNIKFCRYLSNLEMNIINPADSHLKL
jgi:hypothetical protein